MENLKELKIILNKMEELYNSNDPNLKIAIFKSIDSFDMSKLSNKEIIEFIDYDRSMIRLAVYVTDKEDCLRRLKNKLCLEMKFRPFSEQFEHL
jgi:hypothetical protein